MPESEQARPIRSRPMKHWMLGMVACRYCGRLFRREQFLSLHVYQMRLPLWVRALRLRGWAQLAQTTMEPIRALKGKQG